MQSNKNSKKYLMVGNWKMNPRRGSEAKKMFIAIEKVAAQLKHCETVICPPLIYLESLGTLVNHRSCVVGAQDAFWEHEGAYTGQVSPDMIFHARARYVIIGHSERRAQGDTDARIAAKVKSILSFPLIPIICVGEQTRKDLKTDLLMIKQQVATSLSLLTPEEISRVVIAYEPVWAIGSNAQGVCLPEDVRTITQNIRHILAELLGNTDAAQKITILYGGSVDETNASSYLTQGEVQGLLIGRVSLEPRRFITLLKQIEKMSLLIK